MAGTEQSAADVTRTDLTSHPPAGEERGRGADSPQDIPAAGWWDIVKRLRTRVEQDRHEPKLIVTVRGVGYRFDA